MNHKEKVDQIENLNEQTIDRETEAFFSNVPDRSRVEREVDRVLGWLRDAFPTTAVHWWDSCLGAWLCYLANLVCCTFPYGDGWIRSDLPSTNISLSLYIYMRDVISLFPRWETKESERKREEQAVSYAMHLANKRKEKNRMAEKERDSMTVMRKQPIPLSSAMIRGKRERRNESDKVTNDEQHLWTRLRSQADRRSAEQVRLVRRFHSESELEQTIARLSHTSRRKINSFTLGSEGEYAKLDSIDVSVCWHKSFRYAYWASISNVLRHRCHSVPTAD